jgi:hypothetical protein
MCVGRSSQRVCLISKLHAAVTEDAAAVWRLSAVAEKFRYDCNRWACNRHQNAIGRARSADAQLIFHQGECSCPQYLYRRPDAFCSPARKPEVTDCRIRPVGLAGWMYDKFAQWTYNGGEPGRSLTKDEMLDDITLYWLTNSAISSSCTGRTTPTTSTPSTFRSPLRSRVFPARSAVRREAGPSAVIAKRIYFNEVDKGVTSRRRKSESRSASRSGLRSDRCARRRTDGRRTRFAAAKRTSQPTIEARRLNDVGTNQS